MSKKTETIEIRVSPELKAELVEKSRAEGKTMSSFLRERIAGARQEGEQKAPSGLRRSVTRAVLGVVPAMALAGIYGAMAPAMATATPSVRVAFAELDLNGDGGITADEYHAVMGADVHAAFDSDLPAACARDVAAATSLSEAEAQVAEIDFDGNGEVSFEEMLGAMQRSATEAFLAADTDADGYVTAAEAPGLALDGSAEQISPACAAALDADWGAMPALPDDDQLTRMIIAEFDADRDGKVSLIEFISG